MINRIDDQANCEQLPHAQCPDAALSTIAPVSQPVVVLPPQMAAIRNDLSLPRPIVVAKPGHNHFMPDAGCAFAVLRILTDGEELME